MVAMSGTSLPKIRIGLAAGFSILKILKRNLPMVFLETLRLYQYYTTAITLLEESPSDEGNPYKCTRFRTFIEILITNFMKTWELYSLPNDNGPKTARTIALPSNDRTNTLP